MKHLEGITGIWEKAPFGLEPGRGEVDANCMIPIKFSRPEMLSAPHRNTTVVSRLL